MPPHKLFISYSHDDETQVNQLKKHFATLRRSKEIVDWHDRMITAGTEWSNEISTHLEEASVVLFIVSSSFLDSDYCNDVEVVQSMKQHEAGLSVVIPVILRSCDWANTPFSKLQGAPTDAKPLSLWSGPDEFYLDVVTKIRGALKNHPRLERVAQSSLGENLLTEEFRYYLDDTEISFSHRNAEKVFLSDLFVSPDMRVLEDKVDKAAKSIPGMSLVDAEGSFVILGDEQSGKTTLAKRLFVEFLAGGSNPVLVDGRRLREGNLLKLVARSIESSYHKSWVESYPDCAKKVLIIDDFCQAKSSRAALYKTIEEARSGFEKVIVFAEDAFEFIARESPIGDDFILCRILPFSNQRRAELAERWISIGSKDMERNDRYYGDIDRLRRHIDQFTVKNSVPSRPVILVSLLQSAETAAPMRSELTNYGHCYQYIIYQALERAEISSSVIDSCFNYLTELAGLLKRFEGRKVSSVDLAQFKTDYKERFIGGDVDQIEEALIFASILLSNDGFLSFRYRYIYYFFYGKFLADGLAGDDSRRGEISKLIKTLHREESSNVLIYITHHTKLPWVIEEIQISLLELFESERPATLSPESLSYIREFVDELPDLLIEQRDLREERKKEYEKKDKVEILERERNHEAEELPPEDFLATINRLFKGIELTGQIVRNKYGSLEKETIRSLIRESYEATFRFLNFFIETSDLMKHEVVSWLEWLMAQKEDLKKEVVEKKAKNLFIQLNYYLILGTIVRISESVGTRAAMSVCYELDDELDTPAVSLVTIAMELQFTKRIDLHRVKKVYQSNSNNPVVQRILKEVIVRHTYLHPVDYKIQQQLSELLDISPKRMRFSSGDGSLRLS